MNSIRTTFRYPGQQCGPQGPRLSAFSLIELVIVVVIIGMISAIALPRFSRATKAARVSYLESSISTVRRGIELYYAEHGVYPGYNPASDSPSGTWFVKQLLEHSDETGNTQASFGAPYIYGPYLRGPFPANPFNDLRTVFVKATPAAPDPAGGSSGWVAVLSNGDFGINATESQFETYDLGKESGQLLPGGGGGL